MARRAWQRGGAGIRSLSIWAFLLAVAGLRPHGAWRRAGPAQGDAGRVRRELRSEDGTSLPLRLAGAGRRLLQSHQPLQSTGPGLSLRPEGRPQDGDGREQPVSRPREGPANLRLPAREHGQSPRRLRRPERPVPRAEGGDRAGVKHLFIVWFDGLDWPTTQAAAIVKTGKVYTEGKGSGLIFQDYDAGGAAQYGFVVTSPTHDKNTPDVDAQTVVIPPDSLGGGYDAQIAGPNPWTLGPLGPQAPGYLKGSSANAADRAGVKAAGRVLHAYTDSSQSAGEMISGVKSYNNSVNVTDDGRLVTTLFHQLQDQGWKLGTVTSVPFDHVSPAVMYAQNVDRDDYQDLARAMLGLPGIMQEARQAPLHPGLDVVIGAGYGITSQAATMAPQGKNWVPGNVYIAGPDLAAIDVKNGGKYVVVHTEPGVDGGRALQQAADGAARESARLFGVFGRAGLDHLPYRTADGRYDPRPSIGRLGIPAPAEPYSPADRVEQPTLARMTEAALTVLARRPDQPFALFIEAGDVDFALHANNLDNAIGAVYSGEDAVRAVIRWVEANSNWDDSLLLVSSDHGHYLVVDDPQALAGAKSD